MPLIYLLTISAISILIMMVVLWLLSLALHNSSIVDIFWGIGFIIVTWIAFQFSSGYLPRKQLVATLVKIWGLRLALHIFIRNWKKPEDFRYAQWRKDYGRHWWWLSLFHVFLLQGLILWVVSIPLIAAETSGFPAILTPLDVFGAAIWTLGLLIESIADLHLMIFKSNPSNRGKLLTAGLWKFSRHPNYFGEAVIWWGFYLIALAAGYAWTIFSPILMTYLLVSVSGVAMLERAMKLRPDYEEYIRKTSAFIPWLPKR